MQMTETVLENSAEMMPSSSPVTVSSSSCLASSFTSQWRYATACRGLTATLLIVASCPVPQSARVFATYFPLVVGYLAIYQGAQITGTIFGFALLDEKGRRHAHSNAGSRQSR